MPALTTIGSYYIQRKLLNMLSSLPKPPPPVAPHGARAENAPALPARRSSHPCMMGSHHNLLEQITPRASPSAAQKGPQVMSASVSGASASRLSLSTSGMPTLQISPSVPRRQTSVSRLHGQLMSSPPLVSRRVMKSPLPVRHCFKPPLPTAGSLRIPLLSLISLHTFIAWHCS